jgi:MFS family permease
MAELISPMRRVGTVLATFAAGCGVAVALWMWWSDRCGEACPSPNVVHMLAFLGLLPTLGTMASVLMVSTDWPRRVKLGLVAVLLLVALVIGFFLSQLPGT